jgi:hypothetical protein
VFFSDNKCFYLFLEVFVYNEDAIFFQFREDLLGKSKKADDMSRVAGLDSQGIVGLQRQIMKGTCIFFTLVAFDVDSFRNGSYLWV